MSESIAARTLGALSAHHAAIRPDRVAFSFEGRDTTFGAFEERARRAANGLIAEGCAPRTRVALLAKNCDSFFEVWFGAAKANCVLVPVNWRLAPPEVEHIVNDSGAEVLFVGAEFLGLIAEIRDRLPSIRTVIALSGEHGRWQAYEGWRDRQNGSAPAVAVAGDDMAAQLYTSGTTGLPKGAQMTHDNLIAGLASKVASDWGEWNEREVSLVAMPLFHIGGCGWALLGIYAGARNVIMPEVDPGRIIAAIGEERITKVFFVPAVILFMLQHPDCEGADFSSLDLVFYGAAPMPVELLRKAMAAFACGFVQVYGLTETTGAVTRLPPEEHDPANPERLLSCGKAMTDVEIAIVDADGKRLGAREIGEIVCRTPQIMAGYWNQPEETARSVRGAWFHTGDAGYLDEEGYLYIYDRVKDMIISGGENIYPAEVENALFDHPAVADAAVIGVPDERWGESVKAIIVRNPEAEVSAEELIAFARERIAGFKVPSSVDFVDVLPRNPSGKVLKRELRAPFWEGHERQVI